MLRLIGGKNDVFYQGVSGLHRKVLNATVIKSNLFIAETKVDYDFFSKLNRNTQLIPNCRRIEKELDTSKKYSKRFVFISQVKKTKGVETIINAANILSNPEFTIDIYGPIHEDDLLPILEESSKVNYKGSLEASEVIGKLREYDVMLLPTYHEGEGYPGIIIEAMASGIPVITTQWKSIPEMIQDNYNGKLIQPKDPDGLIDAMKSINEENYSQLSQNSYNSFEKFDLDKVYKKLVDFVQEMY